MKKNFMYLMAAMMVAMLSIGFVSCGNDDDDDNRGGTSSGSTSITVDGEELSLPYVYWYIKKDDEGKGYSGYTMHIEFYPFDANGERPSSMNCLWISYGIPESQKDIISDTIYWDNHDFYDKETGYTAPCYRVELRLAATEENSAWRGYDERWVEHAPDNSPLYIKREGNRFTIDLEKILVTNPKGGDSKTVSIHYRGPINPLP